MIPSVFLKPFMAEKNSVQAFVRLLWLSYIQAFVASVGPSLGGGFFL